MIGFLTANRAWILLAALVIGMHLDHRGHGRPHPVHDARRPAGEGTQTPPEATSRSGGGHRYGCC